MNIASNHSLCPDNVKGECTWDPFPAEKVWRRSHTKDWTKNWMNNLKPSSMTASNNMCVNLQCVRKQLKVSGHYSREFERKIKSKER
jgi:hypothetical protein